MSKALGVPVSTLLDSPFSDLVFWQEYGEKIKGAQEEVFKWQIEKSAACSSPSAPIPSS